MSIRNQNIKNTEKSYHVSAQMATTKCGKICLKIYVRLGDKKQVILGKVNFENHTIFWVSDHRLLKEKT